MRKVFAIAVLAITALAALISTADFHGRGYASSSVLDPLTASLTPVPTAVAGQPNTGVLADPRSHQAADPVRPTVPKGARAVKPPVTPEKVKSYVLANRAGGGVIGDSVSVESVQFVTISQLQALLPAQADALANFPQDQAVVYVRLAGKFDAPDVAQTYTEGYRVFDAVTGNELMGGAGPK